MPLNNAISGTINFGANEGLGHSMAEGRIDNRREIISSLHTRNNLNFEAIIQQGFAQYGMNFFRNASGAFAAALVDARQRSVRLLRDPMGLRPLYYMSNNNTVTFGSDVKQVLSATQRSPLISEEKLLEVFSPMHLIDEGWSDPDSTMFENIRSVPYGSSVQFRQNCYPVTERYWHPPVHLKKKWSSAEECAMAFRELLFQVIAEQIDTPHQIAAELSGGIDSGCNVSIAARQLALSNRGLKAYTATFGSQSIEEQERVHSILRRYQNVEGHIVNCDGDINYLEGGPLDVYRTVAHPSRQNLPETFVKLAEQASVDGAKVILSGEGADWYLEGTDMIWDSLVKSGNLRELLRSFAVLRRRSGTRMAIGYLLRTASPSLLPGKFGRDAYLHSHYESTMNEVVPDIFTNTFRQRLSALLNVQREQLRQRGNLWCWSQTLEHELLFPPNHVWQGVPISAEMRLPYLDRRVVEFGLSVPPEYKFHIADNNKTHYGCRKYLQRTAFEDIVPPEVLGSQKKEVYGSPVNKRVALNLPKLSNSDMSLYEVGILDRHKLQIAVSHFQDDAENQYHELLPWLDSVLATELWLKATKAEFPDCRLPSFLS